MKLYDLSDYEPNTGKRFLRQGCMHGDKTLQTIIDNLKINLHSPFRSEIFGNSINTRDIDENGRQIAKSAIGISCHCLVIPAEDPWKLLDVLEKEHERKVKNDFGKKGRIHVGFYDECNFHNLEFLNVIDEVHKKYPWMMSVLVGLNYNILQEPFPVMDAAAQNPEYTVLPDLEAKCKILKENGKVCGRSTPYTARLVNTKKIKGYDGKKVDLVDKFGNELKGIFTFEPVFTEIIVPEEKDKRKTEEYKQRCYTNICPMHFEIPYKQDAERIELFIKTSILEGVSSDPVDFLHLESIREKFEQVDYLDQILRYLTEKKGVSYVEENFYLDYKKNGTSKKIYMPELREQLLSDVEKELLTKI
ncbi:hypothetical protein COV11_04690 [Candidatus Woesearchaeota archaeon CG10_big_fil_rev_8_21_14_0_10_30_7]|nr:MAG: hypothetical protein COV11_04690 [Candidatus Woesearchaeota archaeon CG10_big_fil_rev_8_21_14_0_10_30_7]